MGLTNQQKHMYEPIKNHINKLMPQFNGFSSQEFPLASSLNINFNHFNTNNKQLSFNEQNSQLTDPQLGYEERIFHNGIIATRKDNWHDFFNAVVWHAFPQIKTAINRIHIEELMKQDNSIRSRKRDLLTLFDECGVIVIANDCVLDLIRNHDWHELFIERKSAWSDNSIKVVTFGHAMYEKYLNPYIGMTAQALLLNSMENNTMDYIANGLVNGSVLQTKAELSPLPLLGIPGWHKKQNRAFYADKQYFR